MYFITPGFRGFTQDTLKVISILLLQISLFCVSSPVFAQQPGIDPNPGDGAGSISGTDFVDCIFKDGFEACLAFVEGYPDTDSDGFGDSASDPASFCNKMWPGFVDNDQDCNDGSDAMFPGNTESCDGLDNDCDAQTADGSGDPDLGLVCDTGQLGVCADGTTNCTAGAVICVEEVSASAEVCDGLDNDCDGSEDEGNPGGGASCDTGQLGVCADGTTNCTAGAVMCIGETSASAEVCDGLDNDCDGVPDDGNPDGGGICDGGDSDLCPEGINSCVGGVLVCSDNSASTFDICDGADNDCDPRSADGSEDPLIAMPCDGGDSDLCPEGINSCAGGVLVCSDNSASTFDICDGADNDCDPRSADGSEDPGLGSACETGLLGLCAIGAMDCVDGSLECAANISPSEEICDGYDNDCDGEIDEGCGELGEPCSEGTHCRSGHCAYNVCCDEVCDGFDMSCLFEETGAPDGTCTMVIIGDPLSELGQ